MEQKRRPHPLRNALSNSTGAGASNAPAEVPAPLAAELECIHSELRAIRSQLTGMRKPWLTVEEVARLVGRSPYTVRRWVKEGRLRATRVTGTGPKGRLLIAQDQLAGLIAAGLGGGVPEAAGAPKGV